MGDFPKLTQTRSKQMPTSKGHKVSNKSTIILLDEDGNKVVIPGTDKMTLNNKDIPTVYDEEGEPICGEPLPNNSICRYVAGRGTKHLGYGPCNKHDSIDNQDVIVDDNEDNSNAKSIVPATPVSNGRSLVTRDTTKTYINQITDKSLRESMEDLDRNHEKLYTNEDELLLLKAMQVLRLKNFDFSSIDTEEGRMVFNDILKLTTLRDKGLLVNHELKKATHELIEKREVLDFIEQIKMILQQNLRNLHVCGKCRNEIRHNNRDIVLAELGAIKPLW